jgi:hypothetical protein
MRNGGMKKPKMRNGGMKKPKMRNGGMKKPKMRNGGMKNGMTLAQIRAAAKNKGYKIVKA